LIGRRDLWSNIDRYGLFRPTENIPNVELISDDVSTWKTIFNVHFDMNPWKYCELYGHDEKSQVVFPSKYGPRSFCSEYNECQTISSGEVKLQGLINLKDNRDIDGGFQIVPSFNKVIRQWTKKTLDTLGERFFNTRGFMMISSGELDNYARRIPMPAGSLLVWDGCMAHGSAPNHSNETRFAQFIKYFPAQPEVAKNTNRSEFLQDKMKSQGFLESDLTNLGKKVFGIEPWSDDLTIPESESTNHNESSLNSIHE
jgi:hypothetical protein